MIAISEFFIMVQERLGIKVAVLDCKGETSCSEGGFKMRDLQED